MKRLRQRLDKLSASAGLSERMGHVIQVINGEPKGEGVRAAGISWKAGDLVVGLRISDQMSEEADWLRAHPEERLGNEGIAS